jgi:hypothetical protein
MFSAIALHFWEKRLRNESDVESGSIVEKIMKRSTTFQRALLGATAFVVVWALSLGSGNMLNGALYGLITGVAVFVLLSVIFRRNQDAIRIKLERALSLYVDTSTLTGCATGFTGKPSGILDYDTNFGMRLNRISDPDRKYYYLGTTTDRLVILQKNQTMPIFYRREDVKNLTYTGDEIQFPENMLHIELPDQTFDILIEAGAGRTMTEAMVSDWYGGKPLRDNTGKLLSNHW